MFKRREMDMTSGNIWIKMIQFATPVFLTTLLQLLFNAADMMVVGKFAENGDAALAAVGATSSVYHLITNLFAGIGIGVNAIAARHIGASEKDKVHLTIENSLIVALICGIGVAVFGCLCSRDMLIAMKTDSEVLPGAELYLKIILIGAPVTLIYNFGAAAFRAIGDTQRPLIFLSVAGVLNIILNLLFVIAFGMGVEGVAISTVISQVVSALLVWYCLITDDAYYRISLKRIKFDKAEMRDMLLVGIPSGIQGCMFSFSNVILQSTINEFGKAVVAGAAASGSIEGIIDTVSSALCTAVLTITSQNYGARNISRVRKTAQIGLVLEFICYVIIAAPLLIFREFFISLYNDSKDVIKYGAQRLIINGGSHYIYSVMFCLANVLRGLGYSTVPMLVSVFGIVVFRLFYIWWIYPYLEPTFFNVQMVYPYSWIVAAVLMIAAYAICYNKAKKKMELGKL